MDNTNKKFELPKTVDVWSPREFLKIAKLAEEYGGEIKDSLNIQFNGINYNYVGTGGAMFIP